MTARRRGGDELHVHAGGEERWPVGLERRDGHGHAAGPLAIRLVVQRQLQRQWVRSGNGDLRGRPARVGAAATFTITVAVPSNAVPGTVTNTAQVQANEPDPNSGNDTDSETTVVVRRTDLAIDKRDDGSDAVAGTNYTYTLEVTNGGPSDSSGATVTDTLPAHWQFVASSNVSCSGSGADPETVTCSVGPLVSGPGPVSRSPWPCRPAPCRAP